MSQRRMGPTIAAGEWMLVPIEEVRVNEYAFDLRFNVFVAKSPLAVVAVRTQGESGDVVASGMEGEVLDVAELAQEVPGLQERLDGLMAG